ncbi:hypothetical protein P9112_003013 [Eukaryota sp. TZLM1-RC]
MSFSFGIILIITVVFIWTTSSNVINYIFNDSNFPHPFFLTWFNTSLFVLWLIHPLSKCLLAKVKKTCDSASLLDQSASIPVTSFWNTYLKALLFSPLWILANYFFNLSLVSTSVSSNTILSSTSSLFTLLFASLLGKVKFTLSRLLCVTLSITGVALVSFNDFISEESQLLGDVFAIISALFYGLYTAALSVILSPKPTKTSLSLFWGLVGLNNLVLFAPFLFLFNLVGLETFKFPSPSILLVLTLNALVGTVLSDLIWSWSVVLTSPLISSLGMSLTIPLAVIVDVVRGKIHLYLAYVIGTFVILFSFYLATAINFKSSSEKNK